MRTLGQSPSVITSISGGASERRTTSALLTLNLSSAKLDPGLAKDRRLSVVNATQVGVIRELCPVDREQLLLFFLCEHGS